MEGNDELLYLKERRQQLEERIESRRIAQEELINSLGKLVPNLVSSLDLSLKVVSAFNGREQKRRFKPHRRHSLASDLRTPRDSSRAGVLGSGPAEDKSANCAEIKGFPRSAFTKGGGEGPDVRARLLRLDDGEKGGANNDGKVSQPRALSMVKVMVAAVLLDRTPFNPIDSAAIHRKLENDHPTAAEKNALIELGGEIGGTAAVEAALRALAEDNAGVELEEFVVSGKTRIMILGIDKSRLAKELPEAHSHAEDVSGPGSIPGGMDLNGNLFGINPNPSAGLPRPDVWVGSGEPHLHGVPGMPPPPPPPPPGPAMFPGAGGGPGPLMGPRGGGGPRGMGMMGMPGMGMGFRGVGVPPMHRPPLGPAPPGPAVPVVPPASSSSLKPRTEEDEMKDLEALLNKKSFREMQKSKTGEELLDLIHRPTAKEAAVAAKFKTKGGPQLKEYCSALTKEDCRRQGVSFIACEKVHFRRIIAPHTDINLGDCSFLDTCRHMKTCKYVHYELDPSPDVPGMMMGTPGIPPQKPLKPQRAEYCSEVELGEAQWINCDIRTFRVDILGQFGVIMADPPWDIHMELPYGTMADDEMRNLNVPTLQTDGLIFLWVTGRAMELGRECLELWGYRRVEELIWVKTNQLQRIIRTGRTGHWLNHSKEHCLVGIKGNPEVNRNIDTDVIVAEVRETSRKPDEMYPMLERISPRTRKLELFARMHNTHAGWISLGNQLNGVRLVDEGLRARFKAAYPDTEVQPLSPPRAPVVETEATAQARSPFTGVESKVTSEHVTLGGTENYASEDKSMVQDEDLK